MKETYIRFMAPVVPQTAALLFQILDNRFKQQCERIHLMISSPGGSVFHGLSIHNFLKGAPFEVYTYNFGSVDSIGVVIFCAGKKRFCVPHARFLIHGVSVNFVGNQSLDEKGLEERLKGLQIDYKNIARVIADTTKKPQENIQDDMNNRITLNPEEAITYGLVHEIKSELFPVNADLVSIGENTLQAQPIQIPSQQVQIQHMATPEIEGFSNPINYDYGIYFV